MSANTSGTIIAYSCRIVEIFLLPLSLSSSMISGTKFYCFHELHKFGESQ